MEEYQYQSDVVTVAVVNFKTVSGNKQANLSRICEFSIAAAKQGADLVVYPEMCLTGYDYYIDPGIPQCEKQAMAEALDGACCTELKILAARHNIYIVFGMPEKDAATGALYNAAVAISPEGTVGSYRKIHPYGPENTWCQKGDTPFAFPTPWGPVSLGICYDSYRFPELMRYYAAKGSRLYLNVTALSEKITKNDSRNRFVQFYSLLNYGVQTNSIFIASANLTGYDRTSFFGGGSMIIGPETSEYPALTAVDRYAGDPADRRVGLRLATLDLSLAERFLYRTNPYSGQWDYRPDVYKRLCEDAEQIMGC